MYSIFYKYNTGKETIPSWKLNASTAARLEHPYNNPTAFINEYTKIYGRSPLVKIQESKQYDPKVVLFSSNVCFFRYEMDEHPNQRKLLKFKYVLCPMCDPFKDATDCVVNDDESARQKETNFYKFESSFVSHLVETHGIFPRGKKLEDPFIGFSLTNTHQSSNINDDDGYKLTCICSKIVKRSGEKHMCLAEFEFDINSTTKNPFEPYFKHYLRHHSLGIKDKEEQAYYEPFVEIKDGSYHQNIFYPLNDNIVKTFMRGIKNEDRISNLIAISDDRVMSDRIASYISEGPAEFCIRQKVSGEELNCLNENSGPALMIDSTPNAPPSEAPKPVIKHPHIRKSSKRLLGKLPFPYSRPYQDNYFLDAYCPRINNDNKPFHKNISRAK